MTETTYIGVTIGPITDTLMLAEKPGQLWTASNLFSSLTQELCAALVEQGLCRPTDIITPYYPDTSEPLYDDLLQRRDGLGLFHDHIIFRAEKDAISQFIPCRDLAIERVAGRFGADEEALKNYVSVAACEFAVGDNENPILKCGSMLDCLELSKRFQPVQRSNWLLKTMDDAPRSSKRLGIDPDAWQLMIRGEFLDRDGNKCYGLHVKSLSEIAAIPGAEGLKKSSYFCVLRADGDNLTGLISALNSDELCREFSKSCLSYCIKASELVGEYGGVTVYAGGDDLLALLPCEHNGKTVFDFMQELSDSFGKAFDTLDLPPGSCLPTLSIGAFLCYYKFPLYEALEESLHLLFGKAKTEEIGKNCVVVAIEKHSGHRETLVLPKGRLSSFAEMLRDVIKSNAPEPDVKQDDEPDAKQDEERKDPERMLLSAGQQLSLFRELVRLTLPEHTEDLFKNLFDADFHVNQAKQFLHHRLPAFYRENILADRPILVLDDTRRGKEKPDSDRAQVGEAGRSRPDPAGTLSAVLWFLKFFVEKGE